MKRLVLLLLVLCLALPACAQKGPEPTETTAETTVPETTVHETTVPPTTAPAEATVPMIEVSKYQHPLNGAPMDLPYVARPFAVVMNNYVGAMPLCGVDQADVVCEILAEGGITRCLGIFDSLEGIEHIGAIRSARPYLVELAQSFGAVFVHHGGSKDGYREIDNLGADDLDPLTNAYSSFYRDQGRLNSGYDLEHTSFADGDSLVQEAGEHGYNLAYPDGLETGLHFAPNVKLKGEKAENMEVIFSGGKTTRLTYNPGTGLYDADQFTDGFVDGNSGKQVGFRNVICISANTYVYTGSRLKIEMVGSGEGYYACGGQIVPIKWTRDSQTSPFRFTLADGSPLLLAPGNTYFPIIPFEGELDY